MFWRRKREDDLERELRAHLEAEAEEQQGDRYAAQRAFGNLGQVKEDVREAWGWTWLERLGQDLRYALRTMRQNPGFTATAVLSLALGIGANTAIFSLIDALMLRWLPVRNPQELLQVKIRRGGPAPSESFPYPIIRALADQKDIFTGVTGFTAARLTVGSPGSVTLASSALVTGGYYEILGLNPSFGRLLTRDDDQPGAPAVAVIGDAYWEKQFSRSPEIVGQKLVLGGFPVTIVGVGPRGFDGVTVGATADITIPLAAWVQINPAANSMLTMGNNWLRVLARPRAGVSAAQAQAHLASVWPRLAQELIPPGAPPARRKAIMEATFEFSPGGTGYTYLRAMFGKPLLILMGVVALVLLIACANVANLLLARASARQREITVRLAIGAPRVRVIRQLLTESTLLSLVGAALGIGLAWFTARLLVNLISSETSRLAFDLTPNWHVLGFTTATAIGTGIIFGLAPAFQTTAGGPTPLLKEDVRMSHSRSRLLSCLVSVQVALSLLLLIGAGLFVRTMQNLQNLDPGFRREGVLLVQVNGQGEGYHDARLVAFYAGLLDQVQRIPGVVSASLSTNTPLSGGAWTANVVPNQEAPSGKDNANIVAIAPRFFETMQTPLLAGREFTPRDVGSTPTLAIVNETFARATFGNRNPIGRQLLAAVTRPPSSVQIVGVVKDTVSEGLREAPPPTVYIAYFQLAHNDTTMEIRAAGSLSQVSSAIRKELQPMLPSTPLEIQALESQVAAAMIQERVMATLASGFGVLALVLACVGLYGLLAYSVARRTKEMGIRMALGAQRRRVVGMVIKGAIRLVFIGIAVGLPAAWFASRWVESMLFGLTPTDPTTIAGAALVLTAAALLAAYFPARRASRVDPMAALRHD